MNTAKDVIYKVARAEEIYQPKQFPVSDIWLKFEKYLQRKGISQDAKKRYKFRIQQFTDKLLEKHSNIKLLSEVTDKIAQEYVDCLGGSDISNKTYNETINDLSLVFETFRNEADIHRNPFRKENTPHKTKNTCKP